MKSLFLSTLTVSQKCSTIHTRKEIRDLSTPELHNLTVALTQMYREGRIDRFAKEHDLYNNNVHGTPRFLGWHRHFLMLFQRELTLINPAVIMPYWDWSHDAQEPHKSVIFEGGYFGGDGDPKRRYELHSGPFSRTRVGYLRPHLLQRKFDSTPSMGAFANPIDIDLFLGYGFARFSYMLEYVHGFVHVGIGGDMDTMKSPNDPIFFLHHYYIDYVWTKWQLRHPNETQYDSGEFFDEKVKMNDKLVPYNLLVTDTFDTTVYPYCYKYDDTKSKKLGGARNPNLRCGYYYYEEDSDEDDYAITLDDNPNAEEDVLLFTSDIKKLQACKGKIPFLKSTVEPDQFLKKNNWSPQMISGAKIQLRNLHKQINATIEMAREMKDKGQTRALDSVEFD